MELEWHTLQALELRDKNKMLTNIETFQPNDLVFSCAIFILITVKSTEIQTRLHWPLSH